mmetsp:Transcript_24969/g.38295  ORF Transcript_24969/g.38295 Transcript_24969/m.38295 type:complete len:199 (-) Transcript_24969:80-676(-)
MNAILLILLFLIIDANVSAASGRVHLRGKRTKSNKLDDPQDRTADAAEEDSICQDVDMDLVATKWNLTNFTWHGFPEPDGGEETLKPVAPERHGMTLLLEEDGFSGTCGNNLCWGVAEKIGDKMFWIHALARTKMTSTPQEEAYAAMLIRSPYTYRTCVDSATNHTKLHLFEVVDTDDDGNPKQGRLMAIYDQIQLLL